MLKMWMQIMNIIFFFTILRHKLIKDRVGSSHYDFDPENYKARFQAEKGNLKFKIQSRFN